jgi:hypothetical protein
LNAGFPGSTFEVGISFWRDDYIKPRPKNRKPQRNLLAGEVFYNIPPYAIFRKEKAPPVNP